MAPLLKSTRLTTDCNGVTEAEVSLHVACWLLEQPGNSGYAEIAVDGAMLKIGAHMAAGVQREQRSFFDLQEWLTRRNWTLTSETVDKSIWQGDYQCDGKTLSIKSRRGVDVSVRFGSRQVHVEAKGSPRRCYERIRMQTVIGQALTTSAQEYHVGDVVAVAVPMEGFEQSADALRVAPLFAATGIQIALVRSDGEVVGLDPTKPANIILQSANNPCTLSAVLVAGLENGKTDRTR